MKHPVMTPQELSALGPAALAHVGDGVFELYVRARLCACGLITAKTLHRATVCFVCATAQARAARALVPLLSAEETAVFKRGRNTQLRHIPPGTTPGEYALATGLEALFGYLFLSGQESRCDELIDAVWDTLAPDSEEAEGAV